MISTPDVRVTKLVSIAITAFSERGWFALHPPQGSVSQRQ
jgi:hypothetical protein